MTLVKTLLRLGRGVRSPSGDAALVALLRRDPAAGWRLFLDRYSGHLLAYVRDAGFDHDEAMDRFVYVCEKLAEDECRRLRQVRHLGDRDELVPWLRQVVRNLLVSWAWSEHGRPRLLRPIEDLEPLAQDVFKLHFFEGLTASEVCQRLRSGGVDVTVLDVYAALDAVHGALTATKRWRLVSRLYSRRRPRSLDAETPSGAVRALPAAEADPEKRALDAERQERLRRAMAGLSARHRLLLRLRYDEWLEPKEIAELLGEEPATVRRQLHRAVERLRGDLQDDPPGSASGLSAAAANSRSPAA